jgi:hypothetical protein
MCDYSLMGIPNRLAEEGEELVSHRFPTGSVGLASPRDLCIRELRAHSPRFWSILKTSFSPPKPTPVVAVCVPPGARLILQDIPARLQRDLEVDAIEDVTFTELTATQYTYRDAIRFKNGHEILLQELGEGQRVKVLDLSSAEAFEPVPEEQPELLFRRREQVG